MEVLALFIASNLSPRQIEFQNVARLGLPACQCLSKKVRGSTELSYLAEYH